MNLYIRVINGQRLIPDPDFGYQNECAFKHLIPDGSTYKYNVLDYLAKMHNWDLVIEGE